jgi:hypothetical protein
MVKKLSTAFEASYQVVIHNFSLDHYGWRLYSLTTPFIVVHGCAYSAVDGCYAQPAQIAKHLKAWQG